MEQVIDYQMRTEAEADARIYTDTYDGGLWLSVQLNHASVSAVLTHDQALSLIESIRFALSAGDAA
jgi:hypothetical protein